MKKIAIGFVASVAIGIEVAQTAFAADLQPSPPLPPPSSWAGLYVGVEGGEVLGNSNQIDGGPFGFGPSTHGYEITGGLIGGHWI